VPWIDDTCGLGFPQVKKYDVPFSSPLATVHTNRAAFPGVTVTVAVPVIVPSTASVAVIAWSPSVMSVTPPGKKTVPASANAKV